MPDDFHWLNPPDEWSGDAARLQFGPTPAPISGARHFTASSGTAAMHSCGRCPVISRPRPTCAATMRRCLTRPDCSCASTKRIGSRPDRSHRRPHAFQRGGDARRLRLVGDPAAQRQACRRSVGAADPTRRRGSRPVLDRGIAVAARPAVSVPGCRRRDRRDGLLAGARRLPRLFSDIAVGPPIARDLHAG